LLAYVFSHIPLTLLKNLCILMMTSIIVLFRFQIQTYDEIQTTGARLTDN
jgi:hypothetical protein